MDVGKTDVRDKPQSHSHRDKSTAGEHKKKDEDPLFRLMVGFSSFPPFDPVR
jgi:hypothetical protein